MINSTITKKVLLTAPAAKVNNGAVTVGALDMRGWEYADIDVILGDTDVALTTLKLQQSNDNGSADAYADVAGSIFGTSNGSTLPGANDDNTVNTFHFNKLGKKRYVKPVIAVGNGATGAFVTVVATLSRGKRLPSSATDRGLARELFV